MPRGCVSSLRSRSQLRHFGGCARDRLLRGIRSFSTAEARSSLRREHYIIQE